MSRNTAYLALDEWVADPSLARRLPADLAWRFHALPLAEDQGRVTVVMANPDDPAAREAILAALGVPPYVVRGNPEEIDAALARVWGDPPYDCLSIGVFATPDGLPAEVWAYAQNLGGTLHATVSRLEAGEGQLLAKETGCTGPDLVLVAGPAEALVRRLLSAQTGLPFAVLSVRQPRWPLQRILLIACGEAEDTAAAEWTLRLARHAGSAVTVLAVVPPVPAVYGQPSGMGQGLPALLSSDTPLGRQMWRMARRLVDQQIEGTLRLRQGPPDWQIRRELAEGGYDLVAIADQPCRRWRRWFEGNLIGALLRWSDGSLLIAGSEPRDLPDVAPH